MSNKKKKDASGRRLRENESLRSDGRYQYRYTDFHGKRHVFYAHSLNELREKEGEVQRDIQDGVNFEHYNITVEELLDQFLKSHERNVKQSTYRTYVYYAKRIKEMPLAKAKVRNVSIAVAKAWVLEMDDRGYEISTISGYIAVLKQAFQLAFESDMIRKNPFLFSAKKLLKKEDKIENIIPEECYEEFIDYLLNDKRYIKMYYPLVLAHETGLRAGELCGLTVSNIDFEKRRLRVEKQVQINSNGEYYVDKPKSKTSIRYVPLTSEAMRILRIVVDNVETREDNPCVDGYTGFLFINSQGKTYTTSSINHILHAALLKYQKNVNPEFPNFTFHTMRHMFCTRLNASRMNPKNIQYIVGHASVDMTMNTYTHASSDAAIAEFNEIFEKS